MWIVRAERASGLRDLTVKLRATSRGHLQSALAQLWRRPALVTSRHRGMEEREARRDGSGRPVLRVVDSGARIGWDP